MQKHSRIPKEPFEIWSFQMEKNILSNKIKYVKRRKTYSKHIASRSKFRHSC